MTASSTGTAADLGDPFAGLTTPDLETELLGLAGHIAAAQCRFLQLLAEYDRRAGWAGPGLRSCAHWLSWRIGMSLRTAAEHVRVAHALTALPKITEAFAAGRISYSKVRAITRVTGISDPNGTPADADPADLDPADLDPADLDSPDVTSPAGNSPEHHLPDRNPADDNSTDSIPTDNNPAGNTGSNPAGNDPAGNSATGQASSSTAAATIGTPIPIPIPTGTEQTLLSLALAGTASHVETVVRALRRRCAKPSDVAELRSLTWRSAADGSLVVRVRLTPADGAAFIAAMDTMVPARGPVSHPVPPTPPEWRQRAVEQAPGPVADRLGARRADALLALVTATGAGTAAAGTAGVGAADDADSTSAGGEAPVVARGRARIIVHIDATTGSATIAGGPEIPAGTAEQLACDAEVQLLLEDTSRNRLYLGRSRRLASPAQIAVLTLRDSGRCQFTGCTNTQHLHAHHVRPWLRGGPTDIDNLVLLCSFHHSVIHDRGYQIGRLPTGWQIRRPDGSPVDAVGTPLTGNVESLIEIDSRAGLRITRNTLTPTWAGEPLDPAPLLDALLPHGATAA